MNPRRDSHDAIDPFDDDAQSGAPLIRLNKYLADHGIASRRKCDELIAAGKVSVDDETVTELGLKIDPQHHKVEIDGVVLRADKMRPRYYLLNKPKGVVCTNERREARMRAIDLILDPDKGRIYTVGRLDEDSQGLILLTSDGEFANRIAHPRYGVTKTYLVKVRGRVEPEPIQKIREGVRLSEGRTGRSFVKVLKRTSEFSLITITLNEGKNREVRRVFAHVGFNVLQLRRTHIGTLSDRSLKDGRWRPLLRAEVEELLAQSDPEAKSAPAIDKREDPRTQHFAHPEGEFRERKHGAPYGPGPERRGPRAASKWRRDRKRSFERAPVANVPAGRKQRGERRQKLRHNKDRR
jgi:23S rRNA pseudouridine2605 synthase